MEWNRRFTENHARTSARSDLRPQPEVPGSQIVPSRAPAERWLDGWGTRGEPSGMAAMVTSGTALPVIRAWLVVGFDATIGRQVLVNCGLDVGVRPTRRAEAIPNFLTRDALLESAARKLAQISVHGDVPKMSADVTR